MSVCAQGRVIMMLQKFYTLVYTYTRTYILTFEIFGYENVAKINTKTTIQQQQQ